MEFTVIADDLTGAADSGSYFTSRGCTLNIITGPDSGFFRENGEIVSVNLSSRNTDGATAWQRHYDLCKQLAQMPDQLYMKKIGTGFRGNDPFELEGMLEAMPGYICFIIDHAPDLGTFTLYGNQYCEGKILSKSLYANDPIMPPKKDYIPEILAEHTKMKIGLVDIDAVKGGRIQKMTAQKVAEGCRIVVFDAITQKDTLEIIRTLQPLYSRVFWTGSLGIADGLAQYFFGDAHAFPMKKRNIRSLCFCGSAYDSAKRQIEFSSESGLQTVEVDIDTAIDGNRSQEIRRVAAAALEQNRKGNVMLLPKVQKYSYQNGTGSLIMECFSKLAAQICHRAVFDRLVVVGGETAQIVFQASEITRIALKNKLEPGVAEGKILDGPLAGKEFALKGGSVGSDVALEKMLCHWEERNAEAD